MARVAIVGSRNFPSQEMVTNFVLIALMPDDEVVSGGARGVDSWAAEAAKKRGLKLQVFEANWSLYGKRAGLLRNKEIVKAADRIVAFWDGKSKGTKHTLDLAQQAGKPITIYYPHDEARHDV